MPLPFLSDAALAKAASPEATFSLWAETKESLKLLLPFALFLLGRRLGKGDKAKERRDAEEATVADDLKTLKARTAENGLQHTHFQQEIEKLHDALSRVEAESKATTAQSLENKTKIEATKEGLGRVEGNLASILQTLLSRP